MKNSLSIGNISRISQLVHANYDLVIIDIHYPTCGECAKYQGRLFSISGKDKRFPKLPDDIRTTGEIHYGCKHVILPFVESLQTKNEVDEAIFRSNLPFIDNRSQIEKELYEVQQKTKEEHNTNLKEYQRIKELLPDDAPKSFAGYLRMKKSNSSNYINLINRLKHKI